MREPVEDPVQIVDSLRILEASAQEQEPYTVEIAGREFLVFPGVFSPKYFGSTVPFARTLPFRRRRDRLPG